MRVRKDSEGGGNIRVSIVNPAKKRKGKTRKSHKHQSKKAKAASIRNLRKARAARRGSHAKGKKARKRKARKSKKGKKHKRKSHKKSHKAKKSKGKSWKKGLRAARKALKSKSRKGKRKGRKSKAKHGRIVRPTMYRGRTRKGKKVLRHSPRSRYARKGYRFNPADTVKGIMPAGVRKYMPDMRGARFDLPHGIGGVVGFVTSGYGGGMMRVLVQQYTPNEYAGHAMSLVGNVAGTELPCIVVNYAMKKTRKFSKNADAVARGMRYGGYIATGLNAVIIGLKVLKVGNLPFRIPSNLSTTKELVLSGLGDVDLVAAGMGGVFGGLAQDFVSTPDFAGLGDEGLLDAEISALSAYVGRDYDDFSGVPTSDGRMP